MTRFTFKTGSETLALITEILHVMKHSYGVPESEATARMNALWGGLNLSSDIDLILCETPEYWAEVFVKEY